MNEFLENVDKIHKPIDSMLFWELSQDKIKSLKSPLVKEMEMASNIFLQRKCEAQLYKQILLKFQGTEHSSFSQALLDDQNQRNIPYLILQS